MVSLTAARQAQARRHGEAERLMEKALAARAEVTELSDAVAQGLGTSHLLSHFGPEGCVATWRGLQGSCYLRTACHFERRRSRNRGDRGLRSRFGWFVW